MPHPSQDTDLQTNAQRSRKARFLRHCKRTLVATAVLFVLMVAAAAGSAYFMKGREVTAPDWLKVHIADQVERGLPNVDVSFDDVVAVIDERWLPQFFVRNLEVLSDTGEPLFTLSDVSAGIDLPALLERRVSLSSLRANGVFVTLRREASGEFALFSGNETGAVREEAPTLARLIADLDDFFLLPEMENLTKVDIQAITLRYEDNSVGRVWTVDGGRVRIDRDGLALDVAADLALLGGVAGVATLNASYSGLVGDTASEFGFQINNLDARDIASQSSAFGWLASIKAPISGALRGAVNNDGGLMPLSAVLEIGAGVIQPNPQARPIPIDGALSYFTFDPTEQSLQFDLLEINSKWGSGRLEGAASMVTHKSGRLQQLIGQLRIDDLMLNPADLYPAPVDIESAELDFRLMLDPFVLQLGRIDIADNGQILSARGDVFVDEAGWKIAMDAQMDGIATSRVKALWPEQIKPKTRRWIGENVLEGRVSNASAALRLVQGERPNTYLSFDFSDARVRFMRHMPPVEQARGHASLVKDRFVLVIDDGHVPAPEGGDLEVTGTSFIVPDTRVKPDPPGVVRLNAEGPVTAALSLLDQQPLSVMQKAGLPVDLAEGQLAAEGTISLLLKRQLPRELVEFDVVGVAQDVRSDLLIKNREIVSDRLEINASESEVQVSGDVVMDGLPASMRWQQPIGAPGTTLPGQISGEALISPETLASLGINLPPGIVQGETTGAFTVDLAKGQPPRLELLSDLRGLRLSLPEVGWGKPAQSNATFELSAILGQQARVDAIALAAPGLRAEGRISLTSDQQLDRLRLNRVQLGDWLDASVDLVGRGAGRPIGVELRGGTLDLRNAALSSTGGGQGGPLSVNLDSLQISDTIAITDLRGEFTTAGGLEGGFGGRVNGQAAISGNVTPREGRSAIRLQGADAGDIFASAGLTQQARGGAVDLELVPVGTGGAFDGTLRIRNTRITGAPAIAALLNAISGVGLIDELNGDGIRFSEINADFRLAPSRITLREASAVGASMGLSMDGVFVPDTGKIEMQGVISPVYALNAIGSILTRRGEGLFGFNYSISGTTQDPQVYVNPLTALAPGMFRNLFRRELPEVPLEEGETAKPEVRPPDPFEHHER